MTYDKEKQEKRGAVSMKIDTAPCVAHRGIEPLFQE